MPQRDPQTGEELAGEDGEPLFVNPFSSDATWVWQSEDPETKFGQFPPADLSSYGQAIQTLTSEVGAISTLPAHYLGMFGDQPPSADSIRAAEASITSRAVGKIRSLTPAWSQLAALEVALRTGRDPTTVRAVPVWVNPETRTSSQDSDEAAKLGGLGVPLPVLLREVLGWSEQHQRPEDGPEDPADFTPRTLTTGHGIAGRTYTRLAPGLTVSRSAFVPARGIR